MYPRPSILALNTYEPDPIRRISGGLETKLRARNPTCFMLAALLNRRSRPVGLQSFPCVAPTPFRGSRTMRLRIVLAFRNYRESALGFARLPWMMRMHTAT